jgi:hypothetical protein
MVAVGGDHADGADVENVTRTFFECLYCKTFSFSFCRTTAFVNLHF